MKGTLDSGNAYSPTTVKFSSSYWPPSVKAISVVAYYADVGEDFPCDSHSAHHFDAALSLWSQPALHRLFPEQDALGKQTHRYNYDPACKQTLSQEDRLHEVSATAIRKRIQDIRAELTHSDLPAAIKDLRSLTGILSELWQPKAPQELLDDLKDSAQLLDRIKDRGEKFPADSVPLFLKVTELLTAPGRADCHAMQVNIDNTVP